MVMQSQSLYQAPRCPTITHLPFDLLCIILEFAVAMEQSRDTYFHQLHETWLDQFSGCPVDDLPNPHAAQAHLGMVNKTWRAVILSIPSIWSRILYTPCRSQRQDMIFRRQTEQQLSSTRNTPLDIAIWLPRNIPFDESLDSDLLDHLVQSSPRWRSLRLYIGRSKESFPLDHWLSRISGQIPMLESLAIAFNDSYLPLGTQVTYFEDAPSLHTLEICGTSPHTLSLPWEQVRTLKTQCMQFKEILEIASLCQKLEEWEWKAQTLPVWSFMPDCSATSRLKMPHLRQLSLETTDYKGVTYLPSILSRFSFAQLKRLSLSVSSAAVCSQDSERLAEGLANVLAGSCIAELETELKCGLL